MFEVDENTTKPKCVVIQVLDFDDNGVSKVIGESYVSWEGLNRGEEKVRTVNFKSYSFRKILIN